MYQLYFASCIRQGIHVQRASLLIHVIAVVDEDAIAHPMLGSIIPPKNLPTRGHM